MAYFKLKSFTIWDSTHQKRINIDDNDYNNLTSIKYDLNDYRDNHYDPPEFYNYVIEFSNKNQNVSYLISYTYEYFNHFMNNEYKNGMTVTNGEIIDKLIG
jgi:hypothetical protein